MARIPEGADLIDNPISKAPGFTIGNVHVMAGVPKIFEVMLDGLLPKLVGGDPVVSDSVRLNIPEGDVAGPLGEIAEAFSDLSIGSYPFSNAEGYGTNIVMSGTDGARVSAAADRVRAVFDVA